MGFDASKCTYTRFYGSHDTTAALLILPLFGLEPRSSPRVPGTIQAIRGELGAGALLYRYPPARRPARPRGSFPAVLVLARPSTRHHRPGPRSCRTVRAATGAGRPGRALWREMDPSTHLHPRRLPATPHPRDAHQATPALRVPSSWPLAGWAHWPDPTRASVQRTSDRDRDAQRPSPTEDSRCVIGIQLMRGALWADALADCRYRQIVSPWSIVNARWQCLLQRAAESPPRDTGSTSAFRFCRAAGSSMWQRRHGHGGRRRPPVHWWQPRRREALHESRRAIPFLDGLVLRPAACNAAEAGHKDRLPVVSTEASGDGGFLGV
jgi:hypothetical protein